MTRPPGPGWSWTTPRAVPSAKKRARPESRLARPPTGRATDPCGSPGTDAEPSPVEIHRVAASLPPSDGRLGRVPRPSAHGPCVRARVPGDAGHGGFPHAGRPRHEPLGVFGADSGTIRSLRADAADHDNTVI